MPEGFKRKQLARWAQIEAAMEAGADLEIEAADVPGAGRRVLMGAGPHRLVLTAPAARTLAADFETPFALENDLGGIGQALREAAAICDAPGTAPH